MEKTEKGLTVKKENFSEWFSQVVQKAELADLRYDLQGFIVHQPWAVKILWKIYQLFEEAVEADGHQPILMPTVIPEENLQKEKEHAGFTPEVFWVTQAGSEKLERKLALRPTGETQIYPMYALWIRSYQDLPFKRYQSRITAFRHEMQTRPFLRGREFAFFETHDVFASHQEVLEQIRKDQQIMEEVVHQKLKIPFIFFKRPQWDKFKGAVDTYASDTLNPDGRRNQISSTHDLGQNFSRAFNVKFADKNNQEQYAWQTCFGPGIWRIVSALMAIHGDDQGLILPFEIAPLQIVIVPIVFSKKEKENQKIIGFGKEIERQLKKDYYVYLDLRGITPGEKYYFWELKGVPLRLEIGPEEVKRKQVTLVKRTDRKRILVKIKDLIKEVKKQKELLNKQIEERAENYFKDNTKKADSLEEVKKILEKHRGFIKAPFCSIGFDGQKCGEKLKEETTAVVCGLPLKEEKPKGAVCLICRKKANCLVYIAKTI